MNYKIDFKEINNYPIEEYLRINNFEFKKYRNQIRMKCIFAEHGGSRTHENLFISQGNLFNCFSSCKGGKGLINFHMKVKGWNLDDSQKVYEAVSEIDKMFHNRSQISVPNHSNISPLIPKKTTNEPTNIELPITYNSSYLKEKNLQYETLNFFQTGEVTAGKYQGFIAIPIYNQNNTKIGYLLRNTDTNQWTTFFLKSEILFNFHNVKNLDLQKYKNAIILVESPLAVMYLHQIGFKNTVSTFGWACSTSQFKMITELTDNLIVFYDNDTGINKNTGKEKLGKGVQGTLNIIQLSKKANINPITIQYPTKPIIGITDDKTIKYKPLHFSPDEIIFLLKNSYTKLENETS